MKILFLVAFLLGLVFGVISMLIGVDRRSPRRSRRRAPLLNLPTIGSLLAGFGIAGYLSARYGHWSAAAMTVLAVVVGLAAAAAAFGLIFGWAIPSAARDVEDERYVHQGYLGRVTREVASHHPGEITYEHDGTLNVISAKSLSGEPIPTGTDIVIERIEEGVAYVELWATIERQLELPQ